MSHATTQIIASDTDRVGGRAKIPLPHTVADNVKTALVEFLASQEIDYFRMRD